MTQLNWNASILFSRSLHKVTLVAFQLLQRTELKYKYKCPVKQPKLRTFPVLPVFHLARMWSTEDTTFASSVLVNIGRKLNVHKTFNLRLPSSEVIICYIRGSNIFYTWRMQKIRIFTMFPLPLRNHSFRMFAKC